MATQAWMVSTGTSVDMTRGLPITANTEIQMSKYDDMESPRPPFEPTPWLIIILIVMSIALVSIIDNCEVAS